MIFEDRSDAAQKLTLKLTEFKNNKDDIILALPRGGVILGYILAKELNLPLDLILTQKLGAPDFEELAIGAICEDKTTYLNEEIIKHLNVSNDYIEKEKNAKAKEANRRSTSYRKDREPLNLENKIAIIVDDGIATGATMKVAIKYAKNKKAKKVIVAVPVIAADSLKSFEKEVDQMIVLDASINFNAVGQFYEEFDQVTDREVINLMEKAKKI